MTNHHRRMNRFALFAAVISFLNFSILACKERSLTNQTHSAASTQEAKDPKKDPRRRELSEAELRLVFNETVTRYRAISLVDYASSPVAKALKTKYRPKTLNVKMHDSVSTVANTLNLTGSANLGLPIRAAGGTIKKQFNSGNFYSVEFSEASDERHLAAVIDFLKTDNRIDVVEPDYIVSINATPNDPNFSSLWGLNNPAYGVDIGAVAAWDQSTGSRTVIVGIVDTGIDCTHVDLAANCWTNPGESGLDAGGRNKSQNGIDDDGNGYIDDWQGWNFIENNNQPLDGNMHGTHVAGTIGAIGNNKTGVAGVNWQVSLVPLRFLDNTGSGYTSDAIGAIDYATKMKFFVTNNSWGGGGYSTLLNDALQRANQAGVLVVAAAGNESTNNDITPSYPANYNVPNLISVAAINQWGYLARFSNYGANTVHVAAPGDNIYSTLPKNQYGPLSGTSMATPHVTGALALLKARFPNDSAQNILNRLLTTTVTLPGLIGQIKSGGIINVTRAMRTVPDQTPPSTPQNIVITKRLLNNVTIEWSHSGDDGSSGMASAYEVRIATSPIRTVADWAAAQVASTSLSATVSKVTAVVSNLPIGYTGWLSIRARDRAGNLSGMPEPIVLQLIPLTEIQKFDGATYDQQLLSSPWSIVSDPDRGKVFSNGPYQANDRKRLTLGEIPISGLRKMAIQYWSKATVSSYVIISWNGNNTGLRVDQPSGVIKNWEQRTVDVSDAVFAALADGASSVAINFELYAPSSTLEQSWLVDDVTVLINNSLFNLNDVPKDSSSIGPLSLGLDAPAGTVYSFAFNQSDNFAAQNCALDATYQTPIPVTPATTPIALSQTIADRKFLCVRTKIPNYEGYVHQYAEWRLSGPKPLVYGRGMPSGTSNARSMRLQVFATNSSSAIQFSSALVRSTAGQELQTCSGPSIRWSAPLPLTATPVIDIFGQFPPGADGDLALCLHGIDQNGKAQDPPMAYGWKSDVTPPEFTITPEFKPYSNNKSPTFTVMPQTGTTDLTTCLYNLYSGKRTCPQDFSSYKNCALAPATNTLSGLSDADYTLCVVGRDTVGNTSDVKTMQWTLKTTLPLYVTLTGTFPTSTATPTGKITVTGQDIGYYRYATGASINNCTNWSQPTSIETPIELRIVPGGDGWRTLCVKGSDLAGNEQIYLTYRTWIQDSIANPLRFIDPLPSGVSNLKTISTVVAADEDGTYQYALFQGSSCDTQKLFSKVARDLASPINITFPPDDGPYTLCAAFTDRAGNRQTTPTSITWIKDSINPVAKFEKYPPSSTSDLTASFTIGGDGVLEYRWYFSESSGSSSCNNATYSAWTPVATPLSIKATSFGSKLICVLGKDSAGNAQSIPSIYVWTVIKPPPPVATILSGLPFSPASNTKWSIKVGGERVTEFQYALLYAQNTDCTSINSWNSFAQIDDTTKNPFSIDDQQADGTRTLCLRGKDKYDTIQSTPASVSWLKIRGAPTTDGAGLFGTLTRQTPNLGRETFALSRTTTQKPAETITIKLCQVRSSIGALTACKSMSAKFALNATNQKVTFTGVTAGNWLAIVLPDARRGRVEPISFKK